MRLWQEIQDEIRARFDFVPAMFDPAANESTVLDNLWHQTEVAYLNSALPELLRERLSVYLSRYCDNSYCVVLHSCSLHALGIKGDEILEFLRRPPEISSAEVAGHADFLANHPGPLRKWPQPDTRLEGALFAAAVLQYTGAQSGRALALAVQRILSPADYAHWIQLLSYLRAMHTWVEAYPDISYESDPRAQEHLPLLLAEEPALEQFFKNYHDIVAHEIPERASDVASLKRDAHDLRTMIEASPNAILVIDPKGLITRLNAEAEQLFGYERDELIGHTVEMLIAPGLRDKHRQYREKYMAAPSRREMGVGRDLEGRRKDGSLFPAEVALNPVYTGLGLFVISAFVDITERKRAEAEIMQRTRELERSNAELEQFAYVASHDLQEPLRMVASYTELLSQEYKGQLSEHADQYIDYAADGAKWMQRLINDLLMYSRVGAAEIEPAPVNCSTSVQQVLKALRLIISETNAEITTGDLPTVLADKIQIGQLFQNLFVNAIKFRGEKPLKIHVSAAERDGEWLFEVKDNGIGFANEHAIRIFDVFKRLHKRGAYEGTGIGLAIVKKIVEGYGGHVWAISERGVGSSFYFTLPISEESAG